MDVKQIYGRNDMVMLEQHNKIYGSLGIVEQTILKTAEGNPAVLENPKSGVAENVITVFKMQGWTEQESTTGANLIDYTQAIPRNENQSVEIIDGGVKWTRDYYFKIPVAGLKKNQNYTMSYESDDAGSWTFSYSDGTYSPSAFSGHSNTTDPEKDCSAVFIYKADPTVSEQDMVFTDIMLNEGTTALPYEPYTGGAPSPSPDYPQEIVSSGNWDETAQKWEYKITITNAQTDPDKDQTVTLTADRPLTRWDKLEKRSGQWGWVYGSVEVDMSSEVTWVIHQGYEQETSNLFRGAMSGVDKIDSTDRVFCNILPYRQASSVDVNGIYSLSNYLFARIVGIKSLEDFQEKIPGGKVIVKLSTETFVPLTTTEQEAMNALEMYLPTTVITNDVDCSMIVTYKATQNGGE